MSAEDAGASKSEAGTHREDDKPLLKDVKPRWVDGTTTGAFVSRAASFRYETKPVRWWDLWDLALVYLVFIGGPIVAGLWAVWRVVIRLGLDH